MAERQITMNELNLVEVINNEALTDTIKIAKYFEKNHQHVLEVVDKLTVENSTVKNMFTESTYISDRGREYRKVLMNRDGFTLLAMGFTGNKALDFKLKYIEAFNNMEDYIKNQKALQVTNDSYMIQDPVQRAKRWIEEQQEKQELEQQVQIQAPKVEFAEQLEATEDSITIGTMAKLITQSGYKMGRNSLFTELRNSGLLISAGRDYNLPTQRAMNMGVFEVKTSVFGDKITHQTLVTVKGQQYLLSRIAKIVNEVA
ncbi:Rha family transcriptional regulator [Leuconostoc mesenteroides]